MFWGATALFALKSGCSKEVLTSLGCSLNTGIGWDCPDKEKANLVPAFLTTYAYILVIEKLGKSHA